MKNILLRFAMALAVIGGLLIACETIEPCERDQTGDITVENQTGFRMTFALDDYNNFTLYDNGTKSYYNEDAGTHYFYYWDDFYEKWYYDTSRLTACQDLVWTWYLSKKKSTGGGMVLIISDAFGNVIDTLDNFQVNDHKAQPIKE